MVLELLRSLSAHAPATVSVSRGSRSRIAGQSRRGSAPARPGSEGRSACPRRPDDLARGALAASIAAAIRCSAAGSTERTSRVDAPWGPHAQPRRAPAQRRTGSAPTTRSIDALEPAHQRPPGRGRRRSGSPPRAVAAVGADTCRRPDAATPGCESRRPWGTSRPSCAQRAQGRSGPRSTRPSLRGERLRRLIQPDEARLQLWPASPVFRRGPVVRPRTTCHPTSTPRSSSRSATAVARCEPP